MTIFSARAISCTWNRMVSRFSKVRVITGPTLIRRSFFDGDDLGPERVPLPLIGALVGDVGEGERSGWCHGTPFWRSGVPSRCPGTDRAGADLPRPMASADGGRGRSGPGGHPGPDRSAAQGAGGTPSAQVREASPSLNRPAWLFSARARVSSHSAISSKPSSRAVLANPGYISEYS